MRRFLILFLSFMFYVSGVFAKEDNKLLTLSKQLIEAQTAQELPLIFKELSQLYYQDNKYSDFVEFLISLKRKKKLLEPFVNYYIAKTRYRQLRYLEETQNWNEYFSQGNLYREEILKYAKDVISSTSPNEPLNIYARLLLWQFHKDQEDTFRDEAQENLMVGISAYAQGKSVDILLIKEIADVLQSYKEITPAKQVYRLYVDKLLSAEIEATELERIASQFYQEGNLELSSTLYDTYIQRIKTSLSKEKLIPALIEIAKKFSYQDDANNDPEYAEKVFKEIEAVCGKEAFTEELFYLRAFNLEKAKDYIPARDAYLELLKRYPESIHHDEAVFKSAIISTYVAHDINTGSNYFEKLAQREIVTPWVISSIYQLALLKHWQQDLDKAKEYYHKLLELAKDDFIETVTLAKERLKEILEGKPMEYALKIFLDVSLKEEYAMLNMTKLDLVAHPYRVLKKEEIVGINSHPYVGETGCLQVELGYLWSGHLGTTKPNTQQERFNTTYLHHGTKEVNLLVLSPGGIIDYDLIMVDVKQ
ncbi:MAG: hypothetical protein NC908_05900 [Candidatus Omnitrophica bacterium]|nr:hypothetical protein [Candidatus Omnitrophota bacterium]